MASVNEDSICNNTTSPDQPEPKQLESRKRKAETGDETPTRSTMNAEARELELATASAMEEVRQLYHPYMEKVYKKISLNMAKRDVELKRLRLEVDTLNVQVERLNKENDTLKTKVQNLEQQQEWERIWSEAVQKAATDLLLQQITDPQKQKESRIVEELQINEADSSNVEEKHHPDGNVENEKEEADSVLKISQAVIISPLPLLCKKCDKDRKELICYVCMSELLQNSRLNLRRTYESILHL